MAIPFKIKRKSSGNGAPVSLPYGELACDNAGNLWVGNGVNEPVNVGLKNNIGSANDPTVNDDTNDGYSVGSLWINSTASPNRTYYCMNPAAGAAIWYELATLQPVGSGDAVLNLPILTADPSSPSNGDLWITDISSVRKINVRISGVTYSVTLT